MSPITCSLPTHLLPAPPSLPLTTEETCKTTPTTPFSLLLLRSFRLTTVFTPHQRQSLASLPHTSIITSRQPSPTSSDDLSPAPSSPAVDVEEDVEEVMEVLEVLDEGDESDGADSVTQRIRAFNKSKQQDEEDDEDAEGEEELEEEIEEVQVTKKKPASKKRKIKKQSDSEAESTDYEPGGKGKKGKKSKTEKKGEGKGKKVAKVPEKKVLRAKAAVWGDLPDWGDREDSPLLDLPGDVLDRCFGANQDLELRDFVALAGVNKFFRHHLNDSFFHELWFVSGTEVPGPYHGSPGRLLKTQTIHDPVTKTDTTSPNRPIGHPAWTAFTRDIKPWWIDPADPDYPPDPTTAVPASRRNKKSTSLTPQPSKPKVKHYTPHGPRSGWSRAQYTVYKEEKSRYGARQLRKRLGAAEEAAKKAVADSRGRSIKVGKINRSILSVVLGRQNGEEAVKKDDRGIPVVEKAEAKEIVVGEDGEEVVPKKKKKRRKVEKAARSRSEVREPTPEWEKNHQDEWDVPDTDDEEEPVVEREVRFGLDGQKIPCDFWPSKWRKVIAGEVNGSWINLTDAMKTFKVSKSELITLRHTLITNPLSAKQPQQMFNKPAVEALAYRSHGGYFGHHEHMVKTAERAQKAIDAKQAEINQARENGEKVPKRRHIVDPLARKLTQWYDEHCGTGCVVCMDDEEELGCSKNCWCENGGWE